MMAQFILAVVGLGLFILVARFLWVAKRTRPNAISNWEQRNDLGSPSMKNFSAPQSLSDIETGLGAQDLGGDR